MATRHLLDYARRLAPARRLGLAIAAGVVSVLSGLVAVECVVQAVRAEEGMRQAKGSWCWNCYQAQMKSLGALPAQRLSVGVLSGGLALVAGIQAVRSANGARRR